MNDYDIDGRHYVLEINAYPSRGGVSVFVKDIAEHKQAEDARREAKEEKSALLEEAPVDIVHTDLEGKITYVNQGFESESGYSRAEIIGRSGFHLDWLPASTLEFLAERMLARLRGSPDKSRRSNLVVRVGDCDAFGTSPSLVPINRDKPKIPMTKRTSSSIEAFGSHRVFPKSPLLGPVLSNVEG